MSVGRYSINQYREPISIWRVILPSDVDRDKYIYTCYNTGTISLTDGSEIVHRVKVGKLTLQLIDFPESSDLLGSEVVCVCAPYSGRLYIVDVYQSASEVHSQDERQYRFYKTDGDGYAELRIDGKGKILLTTNGSDDDSEVSINITSESREGKLKLNVNGDILIQNSNNTSLISGNNVNVKVSDGEIESIIDIQKNQVTITTPDDGKIYLNNSEEPILLGEKTVSLISDILDQLGRESAGPYPLLGNATYLNFKERLEELKSTISFVK